MDHGSGVRQWRVTPQPARSSEPVASRQPRRGVALLPSLFTLGNMFCGYACVIYAMRGEYDTAAPFIGIAIVLDMLDGRIARLTGTASEFGVQFDSMADVISFGMAPAALTFAWGLSSLGRLGWAAAFLFVTGAALRLARFNIQTASVDKRFFVGLPSPAAAGVLAATVYAYPNGLTNPRWSIPRDRAGRRARAADGQLDPLPQLQDIRSAIAAPVQDPAVLRAADHRRRDAPADRAGGAGLHLSRLAAHRRRPQPAAAETAGGGGRLIVTVGAAALLARDRDVAAVQLDIPLRDRQTQPGARRLRREVGFEEPRERVTVHSDAGVFDLNRARRRRSAAWRCSACLRRASRGARFR